MRRSTRLMTLVAIAGALGACDLEIEPANLRVVERQDSSGRDEPYFGVVRFRSEFGRRGSTVVEFSGQRHRAPKAGPGEVVEVPAEMAAELTFEDFPVRGPDELRDGVSIAGALVVAMEGDDYGWNPALGDGVKHSLADTRSCLEDALRAHVEPRAWSALALLGALAQVRRHLEEECPSKGGLSGLEKVLIGLGKLFGQKPDDLMGSAFLVQIGVEPPVFDSLFGSVLSCRPFLTNPDQMAEGGRFDSSRVASICPVAPHRRLTLWFERAEGRRGLWQMPTDVRWVPYPAR